MSERQYAHGFPAWHTGFVQVPNEILLNPDLSAGAIRTWALFLNLATRNDGSVDPTQTEAAAMIGVSENALRGYVKELRAADLLQVKRRGQGQANLYTVLPPGEALNREKGSSGTAAMTVPSIPPISKELDEIKNPPLARQGEVDWEAAGKPPALQADADGQILAVNEIAALCAIRKGSPRYREIAVALHGNKRNLDTQPGINRLFWLEMAEHVSMTFAEIRDRAAQTPDGYQKALVAAIYRRAELYRAKMPNVPLTPTALAKWWLDLEDAPANAGVSSADLRAGRV